MPSTTMTFGGLFNSQDETKVPINRAWSCSNVSVVDGVLQGSPRYTQFGARTSAHSGDVCYGMSKWCRYVNNKVYRIILSGTMPTSGTVDVRFNNGASTQTAAGIAYNTTAQDLQNALTALSTVLPGDVTCSGGPWPANPIYITIGGRYAANDTPVISTTNSTMGGGTTITSEVFITGGADTIKLVAIKNNGDSAVTMYKVSTSGTFTSVATGLAASNWYFSQYANRIIAANGTDKIHFYRIGGTWDDTAGGTRPTAPIGNMTFAFQGARSPLNFSNAGTDPLNATVTVSGITESVVRNASNVQITNTGSDITSDTDITVTLDMASTQDWSFRDTIDSVINALVDNNTVAIVPNSIYVSLENGDGSPVSIAPMTVSHPVTNSNTSQRVYESFAGRDRTQRDNIKKVIVKFTAAKWNTSRSVTVSVNLGDVQMHDSIPNPPDLFTRDTIDYCYSFYDVSDVLESNLSEPFQTATFGNLPGTFSIITAQSNNIQLATTDRVWIYRREKATGVWRRLPVDANNLDTFGVAVGTLGIVVFYDKWMESEIRDFPEPSGFSFPGAHLVSDELVLSTWKGSMVYGGGRRLWLSEVGDVTSFAPDPEDKQATSIFAAREVDNIERARTVFLSDNRAVEVVGVVGQDSLYAIGEIASSHAMIGDSPAGATLPRILPGSRGGVSTRGNQAYLGGCHVMANDGLFYYVAARATERAESGSLMEREETEEVRKSYERLTPGSTSVIAEHLSEVWMFSGTSFMWRDRNGSWSEGTFTDSVLATSSDRELGLMFATSKGVIMKIDDAYTSDNGTSVNWEYETGLQDGPRVRVEGIHIKARGTPRVEIRSYQPLGKQSDSIGKYSVQMIDVAEGQNNLKPIVLQPGYRHKIILSGTCGVDKVESITFEHSEKGNAFGE